MQGLLPRKLRLLRAERGLTLAEAAKRTKLTRETLGLLERGKRHPHTPTLHKIAEGYKVPVEDLLDLVEEETALAGKAEAPETAQLRKWIETAGHVQRMIHEDIDELQDTHELPRGWERGAFGARMIHDNVGLLTGSDHAEQVDPELVLAAKQAANATLNDVFRFFEEVEKVADRAEVADRVEIRESLSRAEIRESLSVLPGGKEAV